jgi:hypothetical protein
METMIAYCGLRCDSYPIHLATLEKDLSCKQSMRESIAEQCFKHYGLVLQPGDISDCDGCRANRGRLFSGCLNCEIRKCAGHKNIESCAYCSDYVCDRLREHFSLDPGAKTRLEDIRYANKIKKNIKYP